MKRSVTTRVGLALASIALGVLLIANFKAPEDIAVSGAATGGGSAGGPGTTPTTGGSTAPGSTPAPKATSSGGSGGSTTTGTKTLTGSLIQTRYGPVQVQITVSNGKITTIATPQLPSGGRSGRISQYAAPILTSETMAAQSAQIDLVSGATYTSDAYDQSLQAALDQAGI
jgi:major membrane immunogen (membrane-anchored lipoprotein)